tara:strand:- start:434 stop:874 length:441 start_codon:yes stop_codon:yes gene_type:complete
MDKSLKKERFESLKIKVSVAGKFRRFCKTLSKSQSMTLLLMLEFFEDNGLSPNESIGPRMETLERRLSILVKKRMNGMIAIMKDIEKHQTKPTVGMMQTLFAEIEPKKKRPLMIAKSAEEVKAQYEKNKAKDEAETKSKIDNRWNT